jgi:PAS domain S-box-containing protein
MAPTIATETTTSASQGAWRRSVAVVTALVCATLGASGYINFRLTTIHEAANRDGATLSRLHSGLGTLLPLIGDATAPVNEALETRDVARASGQLEAAVAAYGTHFEGVRRALVADRRPAGIDDVDASLRDADTAFRRLAVDARQAISHLRLGEVDNALRRAAAMNRRGHQAGLALARVQDALRRRQLAHDARNAEAARVLRGIETAMLALVALVAAVVRLYGRRISVALRSAEEEGARLAARSRRIDERFAYAARGTLDGIWDYDVVTGSAFYSERMLELLGLPPDTQLTPARYESLIHPEDLPRVEAARAATRNERKPFSVELRLALPSGEYRWFLARSQGTWDGAGRLVRLTGSISDITARKAGELRLANSTARLAAETSRLAAFVEHAPAAIAMFDSSLRYVAASRRWMDTFLRGSREVEGQPFYELFADIPRAWRTELARVLEGEIVGAEDERWRPADGGPERHLRWEARPWHEQGSTQPGVLLFAQDITRDREREAQLERMRDAADAANRAKSEFLATMSHEIRTPMNGVLGFTQLLLDTPLNAEQREFARTIDSSGRSLLALLNHILDYSKIEAGMLVVEFAPFELPAIVDEVAALLSSQCHDKRLELLVDFGDDAPRELVGDAARVRQVLTNLVGNAIKFTHHGHVLVEVRRDGDDAVRIAVTDTGIGIPAEVQPSLFNKFVQVDSTTTRRFGGTGLGLAICKQLVELMHGSIGVLSREGQGSTFWFRLPAPALGATLEDATGAGEAADLQDLRLLVVDDIEPNRRIVSAHAARWGMRHDAVANAAEALDRLRAARHAGEPYDVAVLDYLMPGMDGEQLARAIRADAALHDLGLVLLTSGALRGELDRMRQAGFDACLTKPLVRVSRLRDALAEARRARDARQGLHLLVGGAEPAGTPATVPPAAASAAATDAVILLAEDHPVNRSLVLRVLAKLGYAADVAEDGVAAVELSARRAYRLILMDCQMPRMDGFEATAAIRARERSRPGNTPTPIVALTAGAMLQERQRCLDAGMQGFLTKPLVPAELQQVLQDWVARDAPSATAGAVDFGATPARSVANLQQ